MGPVSALLDRGGRRRRRLRGRDGPGPRRRRRLRRREDAPEEAWFYQVSGTARQRGSGIDGDGCKVREGGGGGSFASLLGVFPCSRART